MKFSVAVVIPTLGRRSLGSAIQSIFDQSVKPDQIIVIDDSIDQDLNLKEYESITVLKTGGNSGPSYSRNLGLGFCKSDWVAFLDDDDLWLPNHLEDLMEFCIENGLDAAYSSALVSGKKRPTQIYTGQHSPIVDLYSRKNWWKTKMYLPTPGLIISKDVVAHLPFNDNLREREDLWFAHKIYEYQFRIAQSANASVLVNQNSKRSISRTNILEDLKWAERLELVDKQASINFLQGIAWRNALLRRDWKGIKIIADIFSDKNRAFSVLSRVLGLFVKKPNE